MAEENSWQDFADEMMIKFDQNVIFPLHVKYERCKCMIKRFTATHPQLIEWVDIIGFVFFCMLISYLMQRVYEKFGLRV